MRDVHIHPASSKGHCFKLVAIYYFAKWTDCYDAHKDLMAKLCEVIGLWSSL
jgi:hypothetical protein